MRSVKDQFAPWPAVLLIGIAVLAISVAVRVASPATTSTGERYDPPEQRFAGPNEDTDANEDRVHKTAAGGSVESRQDYYDRRREYWEDRLDRSLDDEDLDDETGDDKDADSKDKKDSKAKDEKADKNDSAESDLDQEEELIERRREYWRDRLDREW